MQLILACVIVRGEFLKVILGDRFPNKKGYDFIYERFIVDKEANKLIIWGSFKKSTPKLAYLLFTKDSSHLNKLLSISYSPEEKNEIFNSYIREILERGVNYDEFDKFARTLTLYKDHRMYRRSYPVDKYTVEGVTLSLLLVSFIMEDLPDY